jgi:hypothetical protein
MFTLYFDDSGTHSGSEVVVAACYVATVEQWDCFVKDWREAEAKYGFGVFHMKNFVAREKQFSGWSEDKRNGLLRRLITIIKTRARVGFVAAVHKADYDEVVHEQEFRNRLGDTHYRFAVMQCMGMIQNWRSKHQHTEPMRWVFASGTDGNHEIDEVFLSLRKNPEAKQAFGIPRTGCSFEDAQRVIPLQAPDILAWESLWHMRNSVLPNEGATRAKRGSFRSLLESPCETGFFHKRNLVILLERLKRV